MPDLDSRYRIGGLDHILFIQALVGSENNAASGKMDWWEMKDTTPDFSNPIMHGPKFVLILTYVKRILRFLLVFSLFIYKDVDFCWCSSRSPYLAIQGTFCCPLHFLTWGQEASSVFFPLNQNTKEAEKPSISSIGNWELVKLFRRPAIEDAFLFNGKLHNLFF